MCLILQVGQLRPSSSSSLLPMYSFYYEAYSSSPFYYHLVHEYVFVHTSACACVCGSACASACTCGCMGVCMHAHMHKWVWVHRVCIGRWVTLTNGRFEGSKYSINFYEREVEPRKPASTLTNGRFKPRQPASTLTNGRVSQNSINFWPMGGLGQER